MVVQVDIILNFRLWVHPIPIPEFQHTPYPQSVASYRACPNFILLPMFCFGTHLWVLWRVWGCVKNEGTKKKLNSCYTLFVDCPLLFQINPCFLQTHFVSATIFQVVSNSNVFSFPLIWNFARLVLNLKPMLILGFFNYG